MLLGLRKIDGVSIQEFKIKFVANPVFLYHDKLEKLVNEELVEIDGDQIKLTNKGQTQQIQYGKNLFKILPIFT